MSTYMYIRCLEHDPFIYSERISDHDWSEILTEIFAAVKNRVSVVYQYTYNVDERPADSIERIMGTFTYRCALFLKDHPNCRVEVVNEYDHKYNENGRIDRDVQGRRIPK